MQKDVYVTHKHINRYEREYQREGDVDDDYLVRFNDDMTGWRGMLLYQFSRGYIIMMILLIFLCQTIAGLEATFMVSVKDKSKITEEREREILLYIFYLIDYTYFLDLIFKILYKFCATTNQKTFQNPISGEQLTIDVISVIPFEILYMKLIPPSLEEVEVWLRCRVVLRVIRLYSYIFQIDTHMTKSSYVIFKLVIITFQLTKSISFIHYASYCLMSTTKCKYRDFTVYVSISHITLNSITSVGMDYNKFYVEDMRMIYDVCNFFYRVCCIYTVSVLVCLKLEKSETIYEYVDEYTNIVDCYHYIKRQYKSQWSYKDDRIIQLMKTYYDYFLKKRNGTWVDKEMNTLLPKSQMIGVLADVSFNALKHSHVFKHLEQHMLRFLGSLMKFDFVVPGQVIVMKGSLMENMIYVSHGVLQILSQEDCETSVLSLSGGTCIGEFSLFFQCPSNCTIVCQTYSELVILPAKNFRKIIKMYWFEYLQLRALMLKRLTQAKYLHKFKKRGTVNDTLDTIKTFQRDMLSEEAEKKLENYEKSLNSLGLYVPHFDRIAVSDDIELVEDPVFLKSSFHFILQPKSPLLDLWETLMLIIIVTNNILYPINSVGDTEISNFENITVSFVTIFYIIDVYLQICTATKSKGETNITIKTILFYRLNDRQFVLDVLAAIPFELLLFSVMGEIPTEVIPIIQSNRLLKYYRIEKFLKKHYLSSTNFMTVIEIIKYIIHILFFYYIATMVVTWLHCMEGNACDKFIMVQFERSDAYTLFEKFSTVYCITQNLMSSMNFSLNEFKKPNKFFLIKSILAITFLLLHIQLLTSVVSAQALKQISVLKKQVMIINITNFIQDLNLNNNEISTFLRDMWCPNQVSFLSSLTIKSLPLDLKLAYRNLHYMRLFSKNPVFGCLPEQSVYQLCAYIGRKRIPLDQEVCYNGQLVREILIVERGILQINYDEKFKLLRSNDNISMIEALLDIPVQYSVRTVSDCLLLSITREDFFLFLNKFPDTYKIILDCLQGVNFESNLDHDIKTLRFDDKDALTTSFRIKRSNAIHAIKTILTNVTKSIDLATRARVIRVHDNFPLYWEIFRCCCAYINVLLAASGYIVYPPYNSTFKGFLFFFDIVSFADICIRFHITYYSEDGIEITNRKLVFRHYLTGAFFVDLISCFPFDLFSEKEIIFTRLNRILELYRIIGFSKYLVNIFQRIGLFLYIGIFLIVTCLLATLASWDIYANCNYNAEHPTEIRLTHKRFQAGLDCGMSWLEKSKFQKPLSLRQAYFNSLFFFSASFFNLGVRKYKLVLWSSQLYMALWVIFGFFMVQIIKGCCVSTLLFKNDEITTYQDAMKDLVQYLSYREIDKNLKREVINYFEYIWEKRKGKAMKDIISPFHHGLKMNTLFKTFGKSIMLRSMFGKASTAFLKELLLLAKQETFLKTGILYRVNDIHGTIFYLLKGMVEIVGPDGNRILTLYPGSLFGCLDNCNISRQTLTMVANGHVETLSFPSRDFHEMLTKFPMTCKRFKRKISLNTDFIQSEKIPRYKTEMINMKTENTTESKRKSRFFRIYKPDFLYYYEVFIYIVEYFGGIPYEFLAMVNFEHRITTFIFIYLRDLLWVYRMYLKFHTAYEDEYGMLIYNRKRIATRYLKSKTGFYFDLAVNMPIDMISFYVFPDYNDLAFDPMFHIIRSPKLCRILLFFNYVKKQTQRLNVNVFLVRSLNLIIRLIFIIEVQALILYIYEIYFVELTSKRNRTRKLYNSLSAVISLFCRSTLRYDFSNSSALCFTLFLYFDTWMMVWLLAEFVSMRQIVTQVKSLRKKAIKSLFSFLTIINISTPEIKSIENFLANFSKVKIGTEFPQLLNAAPYYLKEAVMYSMFGHHLRNHPILRHCHIDLLRQIAGHMKSESFYRNYLLTKGDVDSTIYFIQQGIVHAISKDTLYTEVVEHILIAGDCFGYEQFVYPNVGHEYTYKTDTLVVVATVHRDDLMKLLKFFPASKEYIYDKTYNPL